ncbi:MAG: hypothetical protein ACKO6E_08790, partial [Planctomycetota bacterium]
RAPDGAVPLLLLLPGSRRQEIDANLGSLLEAARKVRGRIAAVRVVVGALHERHAALIAARAGTDVEIVAGRSRELMTEAAAAIAVSGSVSLELLSARVPTVIVYRVSGLAYVVQSWFRRARFITLVNLLACRDPIGPSRGVLLPPSAVPPADPEAVYPEYLTVSDPADRAVEHVVTWLSDPEALADVKERIEAVAAAVARPGSAARAAAEVVEIAAAGRPMNRSVRVAA